MVHFSTFPRLARVAGVFLIAAALWAYTAKSPAPADSGPPEENRFTKVTLAEKLDEPLELAVMNDGRVLFIERKGSLKLYSPTSGQTKTIATIPVSTKYIFKDGNQSEAEDGLLGLALDPNYEKNHWIYLYYSPAGDDPKNILTRYELKGDVLDMNSKKVLLEVPTQREQCCHTGGSITFDSKGNLFVSTGDNTSPRSTAYAPIDERPGRSPWDAQKSSGNTNDLRGKILRIHPEPDGTYTIPDGNLFPKGTPKTRPEIYTMGHRNPYRISVDSKTGFLYWGDVGPDAGVDSVGRGPRAEDEFGQARQAGNYGWPYFVGNNKAYWDYDFATGKSGEKFDPNKPINHSPNNTGLTELPPAQKAMIWYPASESILFPQLGTGGRTAMAGPVYYTDDFKGAERPFPAYYNGKLFIYEWMRDWIMAVTFDEDGNYLRMERFLPHMHFDHPMDMAFGPNGDLYVLEYGTGWFTQNDDSRLVRIEYNGGNRKPLVQMKSSKPAGALPLAVTFSSEGTQDYDNDALTYQWIITDKNGKTVKTFFEPNPSFTFTQPGIYQAALTVTDAKGEKSVARTEITAGNDPPKVAIDMVKGNKTFYFPDQPFDYSVKVSDKEDGSLASGKIAPNRVSVTIDYLKEGFDQAEIVQGHRMADAVAISSKGQKLMEASDCKACHATEKKSIGPAYKLVAQKYKGDAGAIDRLANKVVKGGGGVWGDAVMPAHPQLALADAKEIIQYILTLDGPKKAATSIPVKGRYTAKVPAGGDERGVYIMRAAYQDKGAPGVPTARAEEVLVLRNPLVMAASADQAEGVQKFKLPSPPIEMVIVSGSGAHLGFKQIDLTGIDGIAFNVTAPVDQLHAVGGKIEVRLDSPTGQLIGETPEITPTEGPVMELKPQQVKAKLRQTTGMHDVYYVFRNDKLTTQQPLFIVLTMQYQTGGTATAGK